MSEKREYEKEYKVQAVKLAKKSDQQKQRRSCKYRSIHCMDGSEKQKRENWTSDAENAVQRNL